MISADEIRKIARERELPAGIVEKDYAMTWLLHGLYHDRSPLRGKLIFKGGTAIAKVYYRGRWRLSEDLDFTLDRPLEPEALTKAFEEVFNLLGEISGMGYSLSDFNATSRAVFTNVQYVGPLGSRNRIAHDISRTEKLIEEPQEHRIRPDYPDIHPFSVKVYSRTEILLEKMRSMFQRARSRDYYDVWRLLQETGPGPARLKGLFLRKCEINAVPYQPENILNERRLAEVGSYWTRALGYQVRQLPQFESVVSDLRAMLSFL